MEAFGPPQEKPTKAGDVYTFSTGATYRGGIRSGRPEGQGTFEDPSGTRYVGEWRQGKQHGQGVCETADGERYSGSYEQGLPHGHGTYRFKNGNVYEGEYSQGVIHGKGTIKFPDNRRFVGEFCDNKKNGHGRYEGANGIYEGNYDDGKKEGFGSFVWIDGSRYEGGWSRDLMHGQGTKTEADGRRFAVEYDSGQLVSATPVDTTPAPHQARPYETGADSGVLRSAAPSGRRPTAPAEPGSGRFANGVAPRLGSNSRVGGASEVYGAGARPGEQGRPERPRGTAREYYQNESFGGRGGGAAQYGQGASGVRRPGYDSAEEAQARRSESWLEASWRELEDILSCGGARDNIAQRARDACGT